MKKEILHIITGLGCGGAEKSLYRLLISQTGNSPVVISLTTLNSIGRQLGERGFKVISLNLKLYNFPVVFFKLYRIIRLYKPNIVQTWLYHADLMGGLAAKVAGVRYIIWGVRTTELKKGSYMTISIRKLLAWLSYFIPNKIVVVAEKAKEKHIRLGYDASKMQVIPNGFNIESCNVSLELVRVFKEVNSIKDNDIVIGCVGRLSQVKGQDVFIKSAGLVLARLPNVKFLMVGRGLEVVNQEVTALIEKNARLENFILLGERSDVPVCLRVMDIFCLPSRSEGFPNSLGEAMLSGIPCVSTDVGDASMLGGDDVPIAKVDDPEDLANKLIGMIESSQQERKRIGQKLNQRIIDEYSMEKMTSRYQALYEELEGDY
jgi:glycosyltransferase involved in cell wall biosynthesis